MCLGVPGKIIEIFERDGLQMRCGLAADEGVGLCPQAKVGDYTLIHVGFALNIIDEQEALETLSLLREIDVLGEELGVELPGEE